MTVAQRLSADRMIEAKGLAVTLTRRAAGAYNPATGAASITTTTQSGKGVILPIVAGRNRPGESIVEADSQCILSGLTSAGAVLTAPRVGDRVTASGREYDVVAVEPLAPAGLDIIYTLGLRAAR